MNGCYTISDFNTEIAKFECKRGFKHNLQGARVVNELEEKSLNLTKETIWGIIHHSSLKYKGCNKGEIINCDVKHKNDNNKSCNKKFNLDFYNYIIDEIKDSDSWTLEAYVVAMADEIAQRHHDIEDAIEFKILSTENLAETIEESFKDCKRFDEYKKLIKDLKTEKDKYIIISALSRFIVDFLTTDLINQSKHNLLEMKKLFNIEDKEAFYSNKDKIFNTIVKREKEDKGYTELTISFSQEVKKGDEKLQDFLKNRILKSYEAQRMDALGSYVITKLFEAYTYNPQQLRNKTIKKLYENIYNTKETLEYVVNSNIKELEKYRNLIKEIKPTEDCDNGTFREVISKFHYQVIDSNTIIENIYKHLLLRTICDYIAGMTDTYAINEHKELYNHK